MQKYSVLDLNLKKKKVFLRVDFNLPLDKMGKFSDFTRLEKSLPTICYILEQGANLAIFSHLGRPQGQEKKLSLSPLVEILAQKINTPVAFCMNMEASAIQKKLTNNRVVLVENTRFFPEEKIMPEEFCQSLAKIFDYYVNDSFGTAHRKETSNYGVARYFQTPACGLLIKKELESMSFLLKQPTKPFLAILGGAKIKDKIAAVQNLIKVVDNIFIGGGMAYTFLKVLGHSVGKSIVDSEHFAGVEQLLKKYPEKILLPQDHIVATEIGGEVIASKEIAPQQMALDIGENTIKHCLQLVAKAKTIFWNGPLGVFEIPSCAQGTFAIAKAVAKSNAFQVIGGGDSVLAINQLQLADKIQHISTGGGASIELISGKTLPALKVLKDKN